MTIMSPTHTGLELPDEDRRAGRSDVAWAEEAYGNRAARLARFERPPTPKRPPTWEHGRRRGHRPNMRRPSEGRLVRLVVVVSALCVAVVALAASTVGSAPSRAAVGSVPSRAAVGPTVPHRGYRVVRTDVHPRQSGLVRCRWGATSNTAQRRLFPIVLTSPCSLGVRPMGATGRRGAAAGSRP